MATVKKIKKAQRGGCLSTTGSGTRIKMYKQAAGEGSSDRAYRKEERQAARAERKEARAEKRAAKSAPAKYGKSVVKKAQAGKMVPSEMKPGKMIKKADRDARATKMADALDKQARKGSSARPMGANLDKKSFDKVSSLDKLKKKIEKKKNGGTVSMQLGSYDRQLGKNYTGKAKMGKSMSKCKYGC